MPKKIAKQAPTNVKRRKPLRSGRTQNVEIEINADMAGGSDIELTAEDFAFFEHHNPAISFLSGMENLSSTSHLRKKEKREERRRLDQQPQEYELAPREYQEESDDMDDTSKMPIRDEKGLWKAVKKTNEEESDKRELVDQSFKKNVVTDSPATEAIKSSQSDLKSTDKVLGRNESDTFSVKKIKMAQLGMNVSQDPDQQLGKLKMLREFAQDPDPRVIQLCLLTQLSVFLDIVPGYRIRELTEEERALKVSKEVKRVRIYEEALLSAYQAYLQQLAQLAQVYSPVKPGKTPTVKPNYKVLHTVMKCLCELMDQCSHFNFRLNLFSAVVSRMGLRLPQDAYLDRSGLNEYVISDLCCESIERLFINDIQGDNSLEVVKLITKLIKSKHFHIRPRVIDTFLVLQLRPEDLRRSAKVEKAAPDNQRKRKSEKHVSRTQKKKAKIDDELERELKEADAEYDKEWKKKLRTETLQQIFVNYFRVLKNESESILLGSVLKGLARFGHLINIEYFDDLILVLKRLLSHSNGVQLSLEETFYCVTTAFTLLNGQGEALTIDLTEFYRFAYAALNRALEQFQKRCDSKNDLDMEEHLVGIILECIQLMFLCKKTIHQVPYLRVAAFIKRLTTLALHVVSPASTISLLELVRTLLVRAPSKVHQLLDSNENRAGDAGVFQVELDDPDLCCPLSSGLWELSAFAQHWHPIVRAWTRHQSSGLWRDLIEGQHGASAQAPYFPASTTPKSALKSFQCEGGSSFSPTYSTLKPLVKVKAVGQRKKLEFQFIEVEEAARVLEKEHSLEITRLSLQSKQQVGDKRAHLNRLHRQIEFIQRMMK